MFSAQTYQQRREALSALIPGGLAFFPGNRPSPANYKDALHPFRQDSSFLYFAGIVRPDLFLVIDLDNGQTILFGNDHTLDDEVWTGPQEHLKDAALNAGISNVRPLAELAGFIGDAAGRGRKLRYLPPYRGAQIIDLIRLTGLSPDQAEDGYCRGLTKAVIKLRSIKSDEEVAEMEKALAATKEMHLKAMSMAHAGVSEMEIGQTIVGLSRIKAGGPAFDPVVTIDGQVLHLRARQVPLEDGRLLVVDAGAQSGMYYASDITRTCPVGGKFSEKQRAIFNIVRKANEETAASLKPGIPYSEAHLKACAIIAEGLKALGIIKGDTDEAVAQGAPALFMPHGLGHLMGLDTHDMEGLGEDLVGYGEEAQRSTQFGYDRLRFGRKLRPGHVLTVEPGCYFIPGLIAKWKAEGICSEFINFDELAKWRDLGGVRLEDDVLITEDGCRVLGPDLTRDPDEIEAQVRG